MAPGAYLRGYAREEASMSITPLLQTAPGGSEEK
jgi:hypothetical protein